MGKTKIKCCITHCPNVSTDRGSDISFFKVHEANRKHLWSNAIDYTKMSSNSRICAAHFEDSCLKKGRKRIYEDAVPSLNLVPQTTPATMESSLNSVIKIEVEEIPITTVKEEYPDPLHRVQFDYPDEYQQDSLTVTSKGCQTSQRLIFNNSRKRKLQEDVKHLKKSPSKRARKFSSADFIRFCKDNFNETQASFILMQWNLRRKTAHGHRYSNALKAFALALYFLRPAVYRLLAKTFCLPSKATLCKMTSKWRIVPGWNDFVFEVIRFKMSSLSESDKKCVLVVDEMKLKRHLFYNLSDDTIMGFHSTTTSRTYEAANTALVLIAHGLCSDWEQPIAYFLMADSFPADELIDILNLSITKLSLIGVDVIGLVTDLGSNSIKLSKTLGVKTNRTYFHVGDKKVYFVFDPCHLLKSTRNQFFSKILEVPEGRTRKSILTKFYEKDSQQVFRVAPELTDTHLNPTNSEKKEIALAAQVFSATVAAGLNTYVNMNALPESAMATAMFIGRMNNLFDVLNSSDNVSKESFTGSTQQIQTLEEMAEMFKTMRIFDQDGTEVTRSVNFTKGWQITIKSVLGIWGALQPTAKCFYTKHLQQSCTRKFFECVRRQSSNCLNPSPVKFSRAFRKLFALNYCQNSHANRMDDLETALSTLESTNQQAEIFEFLLEESPKQTSPINSIGRPDYYNLKLPPQNGINYVSGYLLYKCFRQHKCSTCLTTLSQQAELTPSKVYISSKAFGDSSTFSLVVPHDNFLRYIKTLEDEFCKLFPLLSIKKNVGHLLFMALEDIPWQFECSSFDRKYLLALFVRVRIFFALKFLNSDIRKVRTGKKYQKLSNLSF